MPSTADYSVAALAADGEWIGVAVWSLAEWANPGISDTKPQLVQELENHLAAALLGRAAAMCSRSGGPGDAACRN